MSRAAGDGEYYVFRLYNQSTGRYNRAHEIRLPSVTTIIKQTLASPMIPYWYHTKTVELIAGAITQLKQMDLKDEDGLVNWDMHLTPADIFDDPDVALEFLKENRLTPDDVKEEAGEAGKEHHDYLERLCMAQLEVDEDAAYTIAQRTIANEKASGWEKAIAEWWLANEPTVVAAEETLYSMRYGFAGTLDIIWKDKGGRLVITDLKCRGPGRVAYESDHVQTGAYWLAWYEMTGQKADVRTVLVAREDGTYVEEVSYTNPGTFVHLLEVWTDLKQAVRQAREDRKRAKEVK